MKKAIFLLNIILFFAVVSVNGERFNNLNQTTEHLLTEDNEEYTLFEVVDKHGAPKFFYRNIETYPCKGKVCYMMTLKVYWDANGDYLKFVIPEDQNLTKLNHKNFSQKDYIKLHNILNDKESGFKHMKMEDLTAKEAENKYHSMDAISGATIPTDKFETVNKAVKTCFKLWKIANGNTCIEIKNIVSKDKSFTEKSSIDSQIKAKNIKEIDIEQLTKEMSNLSNSEYTLALYKIKESNIKNRTIYTNISNTMKNSSGLKSLQAYNYLKQTKLKNKRFLKKYAKGINFFDLSL